MSCIPPYRKGLLLSRGRHTCDPDVLLEYITMEVGLVDAGRCHASGLDNTYKLHAVLEPLEPGKLLRTLTSVGCDFYLISWNI